MSKWAEGNMQMLTLADHFYNINDTAAPLSTGSFQTDRMIVVPCSMETLAAIHSGFCELYLGYSYA
ncbi:Phenylacrylic acid decarboxylase [Penicillium odoratum]|uniref:Phenylacrylic acid decarboxylase n=1 Tax=Penicillium odoratum TaxID=1167516 RepID=UPI002546D3A1|nr:Phenylacrylic acid decarboxylase [Penicillium odoratum]KAJ5746046.1 Phenylacrylic acid decarboxylase [Penicillium odoratum]